VSPLVLGLWAALAGCEPLNGTDDVRVVEIDGAAPENLLLLSLDTLRKDAFARHGGVGRLDFLDGLAERSVVFDRHRSCTNWTLGSFYCAFSGGLPLDASFEPWSHDDAVRNVPGELDLLPEWLGRQGYETVLVSASKVVGGLDAVSDGYVTVELTHDARFDTIVDGGLARLPDLVDGRTPWMLHLHAFDPHTPYSPPEDYRQGLDDLDPIEWDLDALGGMGGLTERWPTMTDEARELVLAHFDIRYGGEMAYLDDQLERLWGQLEDLGALEDTLVWILTDHGEQFFEHNSLTHDRSSHREEVDALAMFWAADLTSPRSWQRTTSHTDLAPTVVDALGLQVPPELRGRVLTRNGDDAPAHSFRYSAPQPPMHSVEADGLRLIYKWDGSARVYDPVADPEERTNLYEPDDPTFQDLWGHMDPLIEAAEALIPHLERTAPDR